jgi:hypothetical protein
MPCGEHNQTRSQNLAVMATSALGNSSGGTKRDICKSPKERTIIVVVVVPCVSSSPNRLDDIIWVVAHSL